MSKGQWQTREQMWAGMWILKRKFISYLHCWFFKKSCVSVFRLHVCLQWVHTVSKETRRSCWIYGDQSHKRVMNGHVGPGNWAQDLQANSWAISPTPNLLYFYSQSLQTPTWQDSVGAVSPVPSSPCPRYAEWLSCFLDSWGYHIVSTNTADTQALLFPSVPSPSLPVNMILCLDSLSTYQKWKTLFFDLKGNKLVLA